MQPVTNVTPSATSGFEASADECGARLEPEELRDSDCPEVDDRRDAGKELVPVAGTSSATVAHLGLTKKGQRATLGIAWGIKRLYGPAVKRV